MNDTYLPLFEDVDVLVTESVISEVRELQKSPQIHIRQKGTHAFTMLDELTVLSTFNLIPSTNSQASLHMYCHQKGLNYKEHTHVQLAYYLKWKEQGTYKPFFVTTDRSTYKTANKIGLNVGFLQ